MLYPIELWARKKIFICYADLWRKALQKTGPTICLILQRRQLQTKTAKVMKDLKDPRMIWLKGGLFLFIGLAASTMLIFQKPTWEVVLLLVLSIWAFCRAYYFAFYVIEHYINPSYKFSGLISFLKHVWNRKD
jgi:hypothetical protein